MAYNKVVQDRYRATAHGKARQSRLNRERNAEWWRLIAAIKLERGCIECGYRRYPEALDFDHRPGQEKLFNIGTSRLSWPRVLAEMEKCDVVCANCHRHRTRMRGQYRKESA